MYDLQVPAAGQDRRVAALVGDVEAYLAVLERMIRCPIKRTARSYLRVVLELQARRARAGVADPEEILRAAFSLLVPTEAR